jgi:hypothetical protein
MAALYPRERPGTHCTGGWVGPTAGLDRWGKYRPPTGIRSPDRPARSKSLYRLSYPALETCKEDWNKDIIREIVCQVDYLPELYEDARSGKTTIHPYCYFCVTNNTGINSESKHTVKYPNLPCATRPVSLSEKLSVPKPLEYKMMIWYLLTAIELTPGGSSSVHIYT